MASYNSALKWPQIVRRLVWASSSRSRIADHPSTSCSTFALSGGSGGRRALVGREPYSGTRWVFRHFSAGRTVETRGRRRSARSATLADALEDGEHEEGEMKSRNQTKRESKRARQWGVELAGLAPARVKQAVRMAGLSDDVYDAVMLVKNLGSSSRERNGKRRQYSYIGGLLRDVDPDVIEPVLEATKAGDVAKNVTINYPVPPDAVNEEDEKRWATDNEDEPARLVAEQWLQGLVNGTSTVEDEVYSIYDVDYDRQELRKLVRMAQTSGVTDPVLKAETDNEDLANATRPKAPAEGRSRTELRQFLTNIVRQQIATNAVSW